ncbi:Mitochondrial amidoxime reducing component 2 [Desmophyllum pertusum]|uniref:Mitochondrial amidoxime reducing component 2 n=1 Tax=Desmophyllum pertusum TaxID=174260 RepID=A0A9W9ZZM8_9CNID|nr:Mitochondrial amidoxime reducing component 2 [Desmophyllum pertusum]
MTTEASLVELNDILSSPVGMDRFRANVIIGGTEPFAEDQWRQKILKISDVKFRTLKDCGRCTQTTIDPETGQKDGLEPVSTLRRTRLPEDRDPRHGNAPFFGIQMAPDCEGTIQLGDPVFISS